MAFTQPMPTPRAVNAPKATTAAKRRKNKKKKDKQSQSTTTSQSEAALKKLKTATEVDEASELTASIVKLHKGSHLYPLSAITTLACFPNTFDDAVDHIFTCLNKLCESRTSRGVRKFWRSVLRNSGAATRSFKNYDETLAQVVCTEWARLSRDGRETELNAGALYARIEAFWADLMQTKSFPRAFWRKMAYNTPGHHQRRLVELSPSPSMSFPTSLLLLKLIERRRMAVFKVNRIVGEALPLELADVIKDHIRKGNELLETAKLCSFEADDTHAIRARVVCDLRNCKRWLAKRDYRHYEAMHSGNGGCPTKCGAIYPYHKVTKLSVGIERLVVWKRSARDAYEEESASEQN